MKRCVICRVEADLDKTGRCNSCRAAQDALDHNMTYGKYMAMLEHQKNYKPHIARTPDHLTVNCEWCGKPFPKAGKRRYCSNECYVRKNYVAKRLREGKEVVEKKPQICPVCKKEFMPKRSGIKYCSHACANSYQAAYLRLEAKKND